MDLIAQITSFITSAISAAGILLLLATALAVAKQAWAPLRVAAVLLPLLAIVVAPATAPQWLPVAATVVSVFVTLRTARSIRRLDVGELRRAVALRPRRTLREVVEGLRAAKVPRTPRALAATWLSGATALGLTRAHTVLLVIVLMPPVALAALGHLSVLPWTALGVAIARFGLIALVTRFNPCDSITEDFDDEPGHEAAPSVHTQAPGYDTDFEEPMMTRG